MGAIREKLPYLLPVGIANLSNMHLLTHTTGFKTQDDGTLGLSKGHFTDKALGNVRALIGRNGGDRPSSLHTRR